MSDDTQLPDDDVKQPEPEFGDELELVLREPITIGANTYDVLKLTEPNGAQLAKATKIANHMESVMTLISLNAKVPMAVPERMKQRDIMRAGDFFGHFLPEQKTET